MRTVLIACIAVASGFLIVDWYRDSQEPSPAPAAWSYGPTQGVSVCERAVGPLVSCAPGVRTGGAGR